jgi:hypothetical protein
MRADRPYEPPDAHHARQYLYALGTVAVFAVVVATYVHSHRSAREIASDAQAGQGIVVASQSVPATLAANVPATAHASAREAAPTPSHAAVPVTLPHRIETPRTDLTQRGAVSLMPHRDERAVAMRHEAGLHADIARNVAMARANLDKNNLGPARRAIMAALAEQPGNGEALEMQAELVSREQERDSLLGYARLCARQADWVCAWHNAGHALTIDASNSEARDMVSRAMVEQSAKGERSFDPSLDTQ